MSYNLFDKNAQVFNVKAYGAKGDGVTDDTTAINAAIAAANTAGGGVVYFPVGNYGKGTTSIVVSSNTSIVGARGSRLFFLSSIGASGAELLKIGSASPAATAVTDVEIYGLLFDGNERNLRGLYTEGGNAPVHVAITFGVTQRVRVVNCDFKDVARECLWLTTVNNTLGVIDHYDTVIDNCTFTGVGYVSTVESTQRLQIDNITVNGLKNSTTASPGYAIQLNYLDMIDISINGNFDGGGVFSTAIGFGGTVTPADIKISGTFRNFGGYSALYNLSSTFVNDVTIAGCVGSNVNAAISLANNNTVIGGVVENNAGGGILFSGSNSVVSGVRISSNNTAGNTNNRRYGICFGQSGDTNMNNNSAIGCKVYDDTGTNNQIGVGTRVGSVVVTLRGNDFSGPGVAKDGFFDNNISGVIYGNAGIGMVGTMTTSQRNSVSNPTGLMIYNSTTNKINVYTNSWQALTSTQENDFIVSVSDSSKVIEAINNAFSIRVSDASTITESKSFA